jgi:LPXTG-motif cell wall-anchored protein
MKIDKLANQNLKSKKRLISGLTAISLVAFSTGLALSSSAAQPPIQLGLTKSFAVLAGSGITNTGATTVSGNSGTNLGSSPTGTFVGATLVTTTGTKFTAASPETASAQVDLTTAYLDAAGRTPATTVTADLGGQTLNQGVYKSGSTLGLTGTLTLDAENDPGAVFIFQAGSTLTTASASKVALINGAQACNVFWQVGSSATFGTSSSFIGHVFALTSITATTGASFEGQLLARNGAVTLDSNTIVHNLCAQTATDISDISDTPELATDIGGELPNTDASNWITPLFIGLAIAAVGIGALVARRRIS